MQFISASVYVCVPRYVWIYVYVYKEDEIVKECVRNRSDLFESDRGGADRNKKKQLWPIPLWINS